MNVAINGLGRIGRATLKIVLDERDLTLVGVNDLMDCENLAYLLNHDSVYGNYGRGVSFDDSALVIDGRRYPVYHIEDPADLPWDRLDVDTVFECTGIFRTRPKLKRHLEAGAGNVILSAPPKDDVTESVVHGVSGAEEPPDILSCASCTTNCITPVVEVIGRRIGIRKASMTTIHAYTSSQGLVDGPSRKLRRGRAAARNLVPTTTGAARAATDILPQYEGRFDGTAVRTPVACGSLADILFLVERRTTVDEVNSILSEEAETDRYRYVLGVTDRPLVSSDVIGNPNASLVDLGMTQVIDGDLVNVKSWYDNEWGYACQMVRTARSRAE
jgi:glyceraldehyde 3-phosphate dehydrogenase